MPPGRRSISQSTVFHSAGVNHFLTCSGLVHAAHTGSGATSTTRSRTRSSRGSCWTLAVTSYPPSAAADKCRVDRGGASTANDGNSGNLDSFSFVAASPNGTMTVSFEEENDANSSRSSDQQTKRQGRAKPSPGSNAQSNARRTQERRD